VLAGKEARGCFFEGVVSMAVSSGNPHHSYVAWRMAMPMRFKQKNRLFVGADDAARQY
jgi:hypothetical protein